MAGCLSVVTLPCSRLLDTTLPGGLGTLLRWKWRKDLKILTAAETGEAKRCSGRSTALCTDLQEMLPDRGCLCILVPEITSSPCPVPKPFDVGGSFIILELDIRRGKGIEKEKSSKLQSSTVTYSGSWAQWLANRVWILNIVLSSPHCRPWTFVKLSASVLMDTWN